LGFRTLIESSNDFELVGEANEARAGVEEVAVWNPNVVVMDLFMKGMNGLHATRELKRRCPRVRVLLITDWARERDAVAALEAGASGLVLKTDGDAELLDGIRRVNSGQLYVAPAFRRFGLLDPIASARGQVRPANGDVLKDLSPRERQVLDLVVRGWRSDAIARELRIAVKTVDTFRTRINRKLGCHNATELVRFAAENDLLDRPAHGREARPGTILLMADDPNVRAQILRDLGESECREVAPSDVPQALAELRAQATASLLVVGSNGASRVGAEAAPSAAGP
jgi:DNA-binding NarL/FixJ family response regulator